MPRFYTSYSCLRAPLATHLSCLPLTIHAHLTRYAHRPEIALNMVCNGKWTDNSSHGALCNATTTPSCAPRYAQGAGGDLKYLVSVESSCNAMKMWNRGGQGAVQEEDVGRKLYLDLGAGDGTDMSNFVAGRLLAEEDLLDNALGPGEVTRW